LFVCLFDLELLYTVIPLHIHIHTHTHIHIHTHIHTQTQIHTHVHVHIHTYIYIHTCIHTYTHTYTHIHTSTQNRYTHTYTRICTPVYLSELIHPFHPSRSLRSEDKQLITVPRTNLKFFDRKAFSSAAPTLWNELPLYIKTASSLNTFKTQLKTF